MSEEPNPRQGSNNKIPVQFHCENCNRSWKSRVTAITIGQACKSCTTLIYPNPIEQDNKELGTVDRRMFGEFYCETCDRFWTSGNSWHGYGQRCNDCGNFILPSNRRPLQRRIVTTGERKPHDSSKCEKCNELGEKCIKLSTSNLDVNRRNRGMGRGPRRNRGRARGRGERRDREEEGEKRESGGEEEKVERGRRGERGRGRRRGGRRGRGRNVPLTG